MTEREAMRKKVGGTEKERKKETIKEKKLEGKREKERERDSYR